MKFFRRHKAISILLILSLFLLGLVGGIAFYFNQKLDQVPRIKIDLGSNRPTLAPESKGINILFAGTDNGDNGESIADAVKADNWRPGQHRSDTIMVLHITADRKKVYLVSIPRDTYVPVTGYGSQKINAAFSFGGPSLMMQTVEQFSQVRLDHLVLIDWDGIRDLSTALGGVDVYIGQTSRDSQSGKTWTQGWHSLSGEDALSYVRSRYSLPNGDYDRIRRQQNFLRSIVQKLISRGTLTNPIKLNDALNVITRNLTVDESFTNSAIRSLALDSRNIRPADITYLTAPKLRFANNQAGSVIIPDLDQTKELFGALLTDELDTYLKKYPGEGALGDLTAVP